MSDPFDGIRDLTAGLPAADEDAARRTCGKARAGGLGRLTTLACWLSAWSGRSPPTVSRPVIAIYAGAGLVVGRGDPAATRHRLEAMAAGTAAVSLVAQPLGAGLDAFDLALDQPAPDITLQAAMSERACAATIAFGMEALAKTPDLLLLDAIGLGSDVQAAALAHALHGGDPSDWTGPAHAEDVARAVARVKGEGAFDPLTLLRQLGGREIAATLGAITAARVQRVPVVLDGYPAAVAAALLSAIRPDAIDHCVAAHATAQPGHARLLSALGLEPLLTTGIVGVEGVGAALSIPVLRAAVALHA